MSDEHMDRGNMNRELEDIRRKNIELERLLSVERARADMAERMFNERLRTTFRSSPIAMVVTRERDGLILDVNEAFENMLGYSGEEIGNVTTVDFGIWSSRDERAAFVGELAGKGAIVNREHYFRAKDGGIVFVRYSTERIEFSGESCLLSVFTDITDLKNAEKALVLSEQKYRDIFEFVPAAIWEYDFSGALPLLRSIRERGIRDYAAWLDENPRILVELLSHVRAVNVNAETMRLYGARTKEELLWGPDVEHSPEALKFYKDMVAVFLSGGDHHEAELGNSTPDGRTIHIILRMQIPGGLDSNGRLLSSVLDITDRRNVETALRESESNLSRAQAVAHVGSWYLDNRRDILAWSDETYRIFGIPLGKPLTQDAFMACIHPDDYKTVEDAWNEAFKGAPYDIEHRIVVNGGIKWVRERAEFVTGPDGSIVRSIGTVQDITESRMTKEALRRSEERFSKAFNSSPVALCITRADDGALFEFNETFETFFGYTRVELMGSTTKGLNIWANPSERDSLVDLLVKKGSTREREVFFRKKSGEIVAARYSGEIIEIDGERCILAVFVDITERKRAEEALKKSEERFSKAFRASPVAICITRLRDGMLFEFNEAFGIFFGYSKEELAGITSGELGIWADPADRDHLLDVLAGGGAMRDREVLFRRGNGEIVTARYSAELIEIEGEQCILSVFIDVTERRRAEAALRESEAKLKTVLQGSPIPHFFIDRNHTVIYWNRAIEKYSGIKAGDVIGTSEHWKAFYSNERPCLADLLLEDDRESIRKWYRGKYKKSKLIADAYEAEDFFPSIGKEGTWLFFTASLIRDSNNTVLGALETLEDITERKLAEEALGKSRQQFMDIIDFLPDATFVIDNRKKIIAWNRAMEEMTGVPAKDMLAKGEYEYAVPFYGEHRSILIDLVFAPEREVGEKYQNVSRFNDALTAEVHLPSLKGRDVHLWVTAKPLYDTAGRVAGGIESIRDITSIRLAEDALRSSEERYRNIFNNVPVAIWEYDFSETILELEKTDISAVSDYRSYFKDNPDVFNRLLSTVRLRDVNDEAVAMYRAPSKEALMRSYGEYLPETLDSWRDAMVAYLEGKTDVVTETVNRTFDGRRINVASHIAFTEEMRHTGRALVTALDITDRKKAEEALRESELKYRTLAENSSDILYQLDLEGNLIYLGPQVSRYGYDPASLLGRSMAEFIYPEDRNRMIGEFLRAISTGEEFLSWFRIVDSRGRIAWIEESGRYLLDKSGRAVGFTGVLRDVTERKRLEEQLQQSQKMESVGRLAGGVAHDFNNILTAIIGNADLLLMGMSPRDPSYSEIAEIRSSAERAANLTRQLLAFSRKQIISPRIMNLNEVIGDLEKMLRRLIGEHITFLTLPDPKLRTVNVDPGQMEQVLTNLVVNARDAMPSGGTLTIETMNAAFDEEPSIDHPEMVPGDYAMLAVSDTGVGMTREIQAHLFEPFFTTKPKGSGTGLGLSTCYGIVKQNHGFIWVYSEPDVGTTVKVYLPIVEDPLKKKEAVHDTIPAGGGTETILVVEDDAAVLSMIVRMLRGKGYAVLTAGDGVQALEIVTAREGKIDILITDVIMPNMDGKTLSDKIKARFPDLRVLFMSGYTDDAIVHHGVLDPGVEFIQKPFSVEALAKKARELLDK